VSAGPYVDAIKGMGYEVLAEADLGCYQGDWVGLVRDTQYDYEHAYGFIVAGYGSCSGCDAWQAATTPAERAGVLADVLRAAHWFEELADAKAYITDAEAREQSYYAHEDGWKDFAAAVQALA
jgi:hypothetical protein